MKNKLSLIALCVGLLAFPLTALSAGTIHIADSVAGLGLDVDVAGFSQRQNTDLVVIPPSGHYVAFPLTLDAQGSAHVHVPGTSAEEAGTYRAFVGADGQPLTQETTAEVLPDTVDPAKSTLEVTNGNASAQVTVTMLDQFGNPLAARLVQLVPSTTNVTITAAAKATDANGVINFTITSAQPTSCTVRALDLLSDTLLQAHGSVTLGASAMGGATYVMRNSLLGQVTDTTVLPSSTNTTTTAPATTSATPVSAQVIDQGSNIPSDTSFDVIQGFEVTLDPKSLLLNETANLTVRAIDKNGKTVENYVGTVQVFSPTDPTATVPGFSDVQGRGQVTFAPKNLGVKYLPLSVSFKNSGKQTLRVEDATDPTNILHGEVTVLVTSHGLQQAPLAITSPQPNATIGGATVTIVGTDSSYATIVINGGTQKVSGTTDDSGHFTIAVPLDMSYNEYTLQLTDDAGNDASIHLVRDTDPPEIISTSFSPDHPQEGESVVLVVQSEPGLPNVKISMNGQEYLLQEDASKPGIYSLLFTAPHARDYQPTLTATDAAGNQTKMLLALTTSAKLPPTVQRLKGVAKNGAVDLTWDPVTSEPIDKYRVYVGEKEGEFAYSLDTPDANQAAASIAGLKTGATYYFTVTSIKGDRESEKSTVITVRPLGILLTITPQVNALGLEWSIPSAVSLKSFVVEYGVDPDALSERREIPGGDLKADEKRSLLLRDLLPDIRYFIQITPITTTGDALTEITAKGQGTPLNSNGTHYAAPDSVPPPDFATTQPPTLVQPDNLPSNGLPSIAVWGAIAVAVIVFFIGWNRRRSARATKDFLRAMESRYHHS